MPILHLQVDIFFLCVPAFCVQISPFYKDISHIRLHPTLLTWFYLDYLCKGPISR